MDNGETFGMLDLMVQEAFCVEQGIITHVNQAAKARLIEEGTGIQALIRTGAQEYQNFTDGCLYLTLELGGTPCGASVTRVGETDIFVLEQEADRRELQSMALAAQELREPLSSIMTIAEHLFPVAGQSEDPEVLAQIAQINRGLFKMLRVIGNMSDAARYDSERQGRQEVRNITSLMAELFQRASSLMENGDIRLTYTGLQETVYCSLDAEKLERAVYNMLSNAMKFTPKGGSIEAKFTRRGKFLYLSVQDSGPGIPEQLRSSVHSRFMRQPALEDGRFGIGLGMVLIRSAAAIHGGTVLIDHPDRKGTRITISLEIRQPSNPTLHNNLLRVDYAGERDHGLIELSDVLPAKAYEKD